MRVLLWNGRELRGRPDAIVPELGQVIGKRQLKIIVDLRPTGGTAGTGPQAAWRQDAGEAPRPRR
jgi:hypothetical protein